MLLLCIILYFSFDYFHFVCGQCDVINATFRCGFNWTDATNKCGQLCPCGMDSECADDEFCFDHLSFSPCLEPSSTSTLMGSDYQNIDDFFTNISIPTVASCGTDYTFTLAFDDAPWLDNNASLIIGEYLHSINQSGTFFISPANGYSNYNSDSNNNNNNSISNILLNEKCNVIRKLYFDYGHKIESHSWLHKDFTQMTDYEIINDLNILSNWLFKCIGIRPNKFRPPYGNLNITQAKLISDMGYSIVLWNIDSLDYNYSDSNSDTFTAVYNRFENNIIQFNNNSINPLFHDFASYNIINDIINYAKNYKNYRLITIDECFNQCDTFDTINICREWNGIDIFTINKWDEQLLWMIENNIQFIDYKNVLNLSFVINDNSDNNINNIFDDDHNNDDDDKNSYQKQVIAVLETLLVVVVVLCFIVCLIYVLSIYVNGMCKCRIFNKRNKATDSISSISIKRNGSMGNQEITMSNIVKIS